MDELEWDADKAAANVKKHGVDFADASTVLHDEQAITLKDDRDDSADEERLITIGMDALARVWLSCTRGARIGCDSSRRVWRRRMSVRSNEEKP